MVALALTVTAQFSFGYGDDHRFEQKCSELAGFTLENHVVADSFIIDERRLAVRPIVEGTYKFVEILHDKKDTVETLNSLPQSGWYRVESGELADGTCALPDGVESGAPILIPPYYCVAFVPIGEPVSRYEVRYAQTEEKLGLNDKVLISSNIVFDRQSQEKISQYNILQWVRRDTALGSAPPTKTCPQDPDWMAHMQIISQSKPEEIR